MTSKSPRKSPRGLSAEARVLWKQISTDYGITDSGGQLLLETALRAFDRLRECQRIVLAEGVAVRDRYGQHKPHPLLAVEKDARAGMIVALKALNLDTGAEPLKSRIGRPLGGRV